MDDAAMKIALELAAKVGTLSGIVEWLVKNPGECLADNPHQLAYAKRALAETRAGIAVRAPSDEECAS
jgi:hypothetical protein